ncbi:HTH domain-containing protein [Cellulosilyticum ruminicola]|uniref:HTH domain-containing protein n=1 Tax=Cellulosilyticum ruminicola TaxID=425254 RepID=UPI000A94E571|nr:HTH domain-containing protein [Cellulosilyticum ruminicola]
MITAAKNSDEIQEAFAYGVIDYLVKPFSFERFQEAIAKYDGKCEILNQKVVLEQADIDVTYKKQEVSRNTLPKGLESRTLAKVIHTLENLSENSWTLKELANHIGVSNVTIKKYMDYLEEMD